MTTMSVYATYACIVWFSDRVWAIMEFICDTPVHKGQRYVTMATNFGTNIVIDAFI